MSAPVAVNVVTIFDYEVGDDGNALVDTVVELTLQYDKATYTPAGPVNIQPKTIVVKTDSNGYWQATLVRNSDLSPANTTYLLKTASRRQTILVPAGAGPFQASGLVQGTQPAFPAGSTVPGPVTVQGNLTITGTLAATTLDTASSGAGMSIGGTNAGTITLGRAGQKVTSLASVAVGGPSPWVDITATSVTTTGGTTYALGAVANADSTTAINNALTAVNANGGGTVLIPPQLFKYSSNLQAFSNTTLMGFGVASVLQKTANAAILTSGATNVRLANFKIDGNNQGFNAVQFGASSSYCIADTLYIQNSIATSVAIDIQNGSTYCQARSCYLTGCNGGVTIEAAGGAASTYNQIFQCIMVGLVGAGATGVWIRDTGSNNNLIEGNICVSAGGTGFTAASGCSYNRFVGNYSQGSANQSGILCNGSSNDIIGNVCNSNNIDGIDLGNSSGCTVTGNFCFGNNLNGIEVNSFNGTFSSQRHTLTANICQQNSKAGQGLYDGIVIQSANNQDTKHHILIGNRCFDDGATVNQRYGINENPNGTHVDNNTIVANDVAGNFTGGIHLTGANTVCGMNQGSGYLTHSFQSIAYAATITPDASAGEIITVGVLTGSITINNPTNPAKGQFLTFFFTQNAGGFNSITWGAAFKGKFNPNYAANATSSVTWWYDGTNWQIYQGVAFDANGNAYISPGNLVVGGFIQTFGGLQVGGALNPSNFGTGQTANSIYMGSGAPANTNGVNGDVYHRTDTPGTANQRMYVKSAGAWVGIV